MSKAGMMEAEPLNFGKPLAELVEVKEITKKDPLEVKIPLETKSHQESLGRLQKLVQGPSRIWTSIIPNLLVMGLLYSVCIYNRQSLEMERSNLRLNSSPNNQGEVRSGPQNGQSLIFSGNAAICGKFGQPLESY